MDKVTRTTNELIFLNGYATGFISAQKEKEYNPEEALREFYGLTEKVNKELSRETKQEMEKESRREDEEDIHPQMYGDQER